MMDLQALGEVSTVELKGSMQPFQTGIFFLHFAPAGSASGFILLPSVNWSKKREKNTVVDESGRYWQYVGIAIKALTVLLQLFCVLFKFVFFTWPASWPEWQDPGPNKRAKIDNVLAPCGMLSLMELPTLLWQLLSLLFSDLFQQPFLKQFTPVSLPPSALKQVLLFTRNVYCNGTGIWFFMSGDPNSSANPLDKFIVPDLGDKVDSSIGLSCRPRARLHRWQAGMATLCRSQLYPPFGDYNFRYKLIQIL